ncbi:MAG: hypothetical protein KGH75_01420 [Rhodospirillales bacterium]|nr:hypothetical protein [Rhodospirillales bacterium]
MADDNIPIRAKQRVRNIIENGYILKHISGKKYLAKCNFQVPLYKHEKSTKRILVLCDWMLEAEKNYSKFLMPEYTGGLITNILAYLETQGMVADFLFIPVERDTKLSRIIEKVKPDHVLLSGFYMLPKFLDSKYEEVLHRLPGAFRGRIFQKDGYTVSSTFSLKYISGFTKSEYTSTVNLLDLIMRDFESAIYGKNRYTLPQASDMETIIIKSMTEWKKIYAQMITKKVVSIDTETENLNKAASNKILTIHFTWNGKTGYCLPFYHKETPFTGKELQEIAKDWSDYFTEGSSRFHIYQNGKFDIMRFRKELNIPYVKHNIYDISSGEYLLSENRKFIGQAKATYDGKQVYTLEHLSLNYGGEAYLEGELEKSDRANMSAQPLKDIAEYGTKDICYPFHIAKFQLAEAERRGANYDKFELVCTRLCSDSSHVMAEMELNGALVDGNYIRSMLQPNSKFMQSFKQMYEDFKKFKSAKRANKFLLDKGGKNYKQGLFGEIEERWLLDISKVAHLQVLFFDILQIKPLSHRKDGKGKMDKVFIDEYSGVVPEVSKLSDIRKLRVLADTFLKGINKFLLEDPDCFDSRLRGNYSFLFITSLRSSSQKPNLQNIPSRGKNAKLIKREFIAPAYKILLKGDFNAHEVRGWGNASGDKNIANAFKPGIEIRRQLRLILNKDTELHKAVLDKMKEVDWKEIKDPKKKLEIAEKSNFKDILELFVRLESEGDVHKKNYEFFFNVPAMEVTDDQRQSVKSVVFGVLYGKTSIGLAMDLFKKEIRTAEKNYGLESDEYGNVLKSKLRFCDNLIGTMFTRFKQGKEWIDHQNESGKATLENVSALGAVRHLSGYLHTDSQMIKMMDRRGPNAIIQGPSSNIGYLGAREFQHVNYKLLKSGIDLGWKHTNMVHDSTENESRIDMLPLTIYYLEHSMTTLVQKLCKEVFGWNHILAQEFEMEIGGSMATLFKFDYTRTTFRTAVEGSMEWMQEELGYALPQKKLLKAAMHNWDLVWSYREKELNQAKGYAPNELMLLTPKIAKTLDWKTVEQE